MAWVNVGMAAASVVGGALQADSAKSASKKAKKGSDKQIAFNREAMNTARADTRHSRQAGATALNALMSMTGLDGGGNTMQYDENGWPTQSAGQPGSALDYQGDAPVQGPQQLPDRQTFRDNAIDRPVMGGKYRSAYARAAGGYMDQNTMYNVNEMGPENVYAGGAVTRNPNPATIDGQTGYVEPNIEGRFLGGLLGGSPIHKKVAGAVMGGGNKKGRWDEDQGLYLGPRGNPKAKQAAPPPGYEAPQMETDIDTTQGQDYNWQTDPGYQFRFEEGQRALDRGAAARGGLLSGGYGRKAIRYGQGFASNEYTNVYNRIAGIAGMGQTANQHAGNAAQYGGAAMGQGAAASGINSAYGAIGQGNAYGTAINQLGQVDWGNIWQGNQAQAPGGAVNRPPAGPGGGGSW